MERRLERIASRKPGGWTIVAGTLAAALLVALACEAPGPTASEERATVAAPEPSIERVVVEGVAGSASSPPEEALEVARVRAGSAAGSDDPEGSPLYVVDGVERADLEDLDPNDIESISVYKNGDVVERFGERAANGLILITTKAGGGSEDASAP